MVAPLTHTALASHALSLTLSFDAGPNPQQREMEWELREYLNNTRIEEIKDNKIKSMKREWDWVEDGLKTYNQ